MDFDLPCPRDRPTTGLHSQRPRTAVPDHQPPHPDGSFWKPIKTLQGTGRLVATRSSPTRSPRKRPGTSAFSLKTDQRRAPPQLWRTIRALHHCSAGNRSRFGLVMGLILGPQPHKFFSPSVQADAVKRFGAWVACVGTRPEARRTSPRGPGRRTAHASLSHLRACRVARIGHRQFIAEHCPASLAMDSSWARNDNGTPR